MTHTTVDTQAQNSGSLRSVYHTIDITSLDSSGSETYDAESETGLNNILGISVNGQEADDLFIRYDHVASNIIVTNASDGTAVASGTDIGEVVLKVDGNPAP